VQPVASRYTDYAIPAPTVDSRKPYITSIGVFETEDICSFFFSERGISDLKGLNCDTILYFAVFIINLLASIRSVNKFTCHFFPLRQSHSQKSHCFSDAEMDVNFLLTPATGRNDRFRAET
jgi:hypothetical protein